MIGWAEEGTMPVLIVIFVLALCGGGFFIAPVDVRVPVESLLCLLIATVAFAGGVVARAVHRLSDTLTRRPPA